MAIRHYVLLATDGFIKLPTNADLCPSPDGLKDVYVFGFVGGLYKVDDEIINPVLDWSNPQNWPALDAMTGTATIPSPAVWCEVGDHLYITLINLGMPTTGLMDFHTIHMHGAHVPTQIDGFPETSFGVPMWMDKANFPPAITYFFEPEHPGTQMYHCHIEAAEHVQMGMYGALVVYPSVRSLCLNGIKQNKKGRWFCHGVYQPQIPKTATNRNFAYNDINTYFDREYIMLLSDIDSVWHQTVQSGGIFNAVNFRPDFWLVNGRAFPDTLLPHPQTEPFMGHPDLTQINYESYVHVKTRDSFLLRMINMGYQVVPWHIHGWHFTVVGKDTSISPFLKIASKLSQAEHEDMNIMSDMVQAQMHHQGLIHNEMLEHGFTITIGSGETYDLMLEADDKSVIYENYILNGQDGIPSLCYQMKELKKIDPGSIADIPLQPVHCPQPETVNYVDICDGIQGEYGFFPQFYPMHNHDDYKVTNNGVYPGGQLTYIQTDAPQMQSLK